MSVMLAAEEHGPYRLRREVPSALGELLRAARHEANLTQAQLAERAGISERGVSDIERGVIATPNMSTMRALAEALRLPDTMLDELFSARGPRTRRHRARSMRPIRVPVTRLVDRVDDVAAVTRLVCAPGTRLVSLLGPGGVGKTRLALAVAKELERRFDGQVAFIELAEARDVSQAQTTILDALEIPGNPWQSLQAQLHAALRDSRTLLILDNIEQLQVGMVLVDLLAMCPALRIMTTSRQPLGVRGEYQYEVRPLALPAERWVPAAGELEAAPATALFLQCARCLPVDLPLTAQNRIDIDAICRLAEGVPLRIEQAASLLSTRSLTEIAWHMREPLACLRSAPADLPPRHQSLEASVRWSYDLLTADEQRLLRLVSTIEGEFTEDEVSFRARLAADGPPTAHGAVQCLRALVEKHLIYQKREPAGATYHLPVHIRAFARAQAVLREQAVAARAQG